MYHPKEEEGLKVFESALTNQIEEFKSIQQSEEINQMTKLID